MGGTGRIYANGLQVSWLRKNGWMEGQTIYLFSIYICHLCRHANGTELKIVKEWKPVLNQMRDNQALLQSLRNSPYYGQFREQIQLWEQKVAMLEQSLHHLNEIQRKWVYLEPIFGRGSLPAEAARFNRIDVEFHVILGDIARCE